jgi:hypothetical protein
MIALAVCALRPRPACPDQESPKPIQPETTNTNAIDQIPAATQESRTLKPDELGTALYLLARDPFNDKLVARLKPAILNNTADTGQMPFLLTIYCLGCLVTDQADEAQECWSRFGETYAEDPDFAELSLTNLTVKCMPCDGAGTQTNTCSTCKVEPGLCRYCHGSGIRVFGVSGTTTTCPGCSGPGRCRTCNGVGEVTEKCARCKGKGAVFARKNAKSSYLELLRNFK